MGIVPIQINTTEEYLARLNLTLGEAQREIQFLIWHFGKRFKKLFPTELQSEDIGRLVQIAAELRPIRKCSGFVRHLDEYTKTTIEDHLFTARVAAWLLGLGYEVELEPVPLVSGGHKPDLLIKRGALKFAVECKNINISSVYEVDEKKKMADTIYSAVRTCDQINVYLERRFPTEQVQHIFSDPKLQSDIYKAGMNASEIRLKPVEGLEILVLPQPAVLGSEEEYDTVYAVGIMGDVGTRFKRPALVLMKGGRSVQVIGPYPDYSRRWNDKRSSSKKQAVPGLPLVVVVNGDHSLDHPDLREDYLHNVWLTQKNNMCSGVGFISFATISGEIEFEYFSNPHAKHPCASISKEEGARQ